MSVLIISVHFDKCQVCVWRIPQPQLLCSSMRLVRHLLLSTFYLFLDVWKSLTTSCWYGGFMDGTWFQGLRNVIKSFIWKLYGMCRQINHRLCPANGAVLLCLKKMCKRPWCSSLYSISTGPAHLERGHGTDIRSISSGLFSRLLMPWCS